MKHLVYLAAVVLLSSCFLNQSAPTALQAQKTAVTGELVMADIHGTNEEAGIIAGFYPTPAAKSGAREIMAASWLASGESERNALMNRIATLSAFSAAFSASLSAPERAEEDCDFEELPITTARDAATYLSAGEILYAPAGSSTGTKLDKQSDGSYFKALKVGFPPGDFQFAVKGAEQVPGFSAEMTMPEVLEGVKVNGLETKYSWEIKVSEPLKASWAAPLNKHDKNLLVLRLSAQTDKIVARLTCYTPEKVFYSGAGPEYVWEVSTKWMSKLPKTPLARFDLKRLQGYVGQVDNLQALIQGVRVVHNFGALE